MLSLSKFPDNFVTLNLISIQFMSTILSLTQKRVSIFFSALHSANFDSLTLTKMEVRKSSSAARDHGTCVGRSEVDMVFKSLGMVVSDNDDGAIMSRLDLSDVFEERDPSLDEIRQAFDAFDEGRDGFIDAMDLQKVLFRLGFGEGREIGDCRRMIGVFDDDGDGRLDFQEFVKFMEKTTFC